MLRVNYFLQFIGYVRQVSLTCAIQKLCVHVVFLLNSSQVD